MKFKPIMKEGDWENIEAIQQNPGWKSLQKWVDLQVYNTAQRALQVGKTRQTQRSEQSETSVEQSVPEQLSSLRGEAFAYRRMINIIDKADKEKDKITKRRKAFEKKRKEK